jgi:hypothetical protein
MRGVDVSSRLEQLLASIDPERTILDVERRVDQAFNTFPKPSGILSSWPVFRDYLGRFVCHLETAVLNLPPSHCVDPDMDFGRACRLMMKEFGPDGDKTAANMAMFGVEGGLYQVLKAVARRLAEEYGENEIKARIAAYWNALSVDEKLDATREYLATFGHLLPADVTNGGAARLRAYFPQFLAKHPDLVRRLRNVGR